MEIETLVRVILQYLPIENHIISAYPQQIAIPNACKLPLYFCFSLRNFQSSCIQTNSIVAHHTWWSSYPLWMKVINHCNHLFCSFQHLLEVPWVYFISWFFWNKYFFYSDNLLNAVMVYWKSYSHLNLIRFIAATLL